MPQTYTNKILEKSGLTQFELILVAAKRASELEKGHTPKIDMKGSPVVVALAEIEKGFICK